MMGAPIQSAPLYVIVVGDLGMKWYKMDALVWVRAHNCYACLSLCIFYCLELKTVPDCRIPA